MSIDRKFEITARSKNSGTFYNEDNSVLFLARDPGTPSAIRAYYEQCREMGCSDNQLDSIEALYERVITFQAEHGFQKAEVETEEELLRLTK